MKELYRSLVTTIKTRRGYQKIESELPRLYSMLKYPKEYADHDARMVRQNASDSQGIGAGYIDVIAVKSDAETWQLTRRFLNDAGLASCPSHPDQWDLSHTRNFFFFFDNLLQSDTTQRSKPFSFPGETVSHSDIWLGLHPQYRSETTTPKAWFKLFLNEGPSNHGYNVKRNLVISMACCWDSYVQSLGSSSQPMSLASINSPSRRSSSSGSYQSGAGASTGRLFSFFNNVILPAIFIISGIFLNIYLYVLLCFLITFSSIGFMWWSNNRKLSRASVRPVLADMVAPHLVQPAEVFNPAIDSVIDGFISGYPGSRGMGKKSCSHGFSNRIKLCLNGQGMVVDSIANRWGVAAGILADSSSSGKLALLHNYLLHIFPFDDELADFDASGFVACLLRRVPITRGYGYEVSRIQNELKSCSKAFASQVTDLLEERAKSGYWPVEDCRKALSSLTHRFVGGTNGSYRDIMNKLGFKKENPIYKESSTICVPKDNLLGLYLHTRERLRNELKIPHVLVELLLPHALKEEVLDSLSYHLYNGALVQDLLELSIETVQASHRTSLSRDDDLFIRTEWRQDVTSGPLFEWRISLMPEKEFVHFVGDVVQDPSDYDQSAIGVIKERLESVLNDNRGDLSDYFDVEGFDEAYQLFFFWPKLAARM